MKCEWCGSRTNDTVEYIDALGDKHMICKSCQKTVDNCECRKCGDTVDTSMMINGLCMNCIQAEMLSKSKKKEEARLGVDSDIMDTMSSDIELTESDYERWMTMGKAFSPSDMQSSKELRRIWIMVKFNATGVYEPETISKHIDDIEKILDRNLSKLVGNKCKVVIANNAEMRKLVRQKEVIDYEREIYIFKV